MGITAGSILQAKAAISTREELRAQVTTTEYARLEQKASKHSAGLMIVPVYSTLDGAWVGNLAL